MPSLGSGFRERAARSLSAVLVLSVFLPPGPVKAEPTAAPITARLASADAARGKKLFLQCAVCHVSKPGAGVTTGPNLWNVVGRKIAADPDFDYSDSLKKVGGDWDIERLDVYLSDPKLVAPEGRMPFPGVKSAEERGHLIAYLIALSDDPVALPDAPVSDINQLADETGFVEKNGEDSAKWQGLPPGPGRDDVFYRCKACHSLMIVKQQGLSRAAWDESLDWMVDEQGMPPIEEDVVRNRILDYLASHFGLK
jgi:cytochrome c